MVKKDITTMVGATPSEELSPYLAGLAVTDATPAPKRANAPAPSAEIEPKPEPEPMPEQEPTATSMRERKERGPGRRYTTIRLSEDAYSSIARAAQCYRIATGNNLSLGDFVALSVKRALPHLSKQAYQVMVSLQKDTSSPS